MGRDILTTKNTKKDRAAYVRDWRKRNPAKYAATMARYWTKKAAELAQQEGGEFDDSTNGKTVDA